MEPRNQGDSNGISFEASLLRALPIAMAAVDQDGKLVLWNASMEELTGKSAPEWLGKNAWAGWVPKAVCAALMQSVKGC